MVEASIVFETKALSVKTIACSGNTSHAESIILQVKGSVLS